MKYFADEIEPFGDKGAIVSLTASEVPDEFPLVSTNDMDGIEAGVKLLPSSTVTVTNSGGMRIFMLNSDYEWNEI